MFTGWYYHPVYFSQIFEDLLFFWFQERDHPAGDECCVLWVCSDQAELNLDPEKNLNSKKQSKDEGKKRTDITEKDSTAKTNIEPGNEQQGFELLIDQISGKNFPFIYKKIWKECSEGENNISQYTCTLGFLFFILPYL